MPFRVELSKSAFKLLKNLPLATRKRILSKLLLLKENPIPRGALKLRGEVDVYMVRVGDYRVLYKIIWREKVILIFKIAYRRHVYGGM